MFRAVLTPFRVDNTRCSRNSARRFRVLFAVFAACLSLLLLLSQPRQRVMAQQTQVSLEVVGLLNEWRVEQGLWPLKVNPTLESLALLQAQYIASLAEAPEGGDIHLNAKGQGPAQRALLQPYAWPSYGRSDRTAVGENAAIGSVQYAMGFWKSSDIHRNTALNAGYREIGVAALPYQSGYLFITVFGARPNILPALVDPRTNKLFLTNERYRYASGGTWIHNADRVRLFDADGRPLGDDSIPWQATIDIPQNAGSKLYALYTDGSAQAISEVRLDQDIAVLPGVSTAAASSPTAVPTVPRTSPTATATAAPPELQPGDPDLLIVYDDLDLTVINIAPQALNLQALELVGSNTRLPFTRWGTVVKLPLEAFPSKHCLQVRSITVTTYVDMPTTCLWTRSVLTWSPDQLFWTKGDFEVRTGSTVLAVCKREAGNCEVHLSTPG